MGERAEIPVIAARYSFLWLCLGNIVGCWLGLVLLIPQLGGIIAPFSYGRLMPMHMDWHLYGWSSIPLVGLLMTVYFARLRNVMLWTHLGLLFWSLGLLSSGFLAAAGLSSGKLFLSWGGASRVLFPLGQAGLLALLLWGFIRLCRDGTTGKWLLAGQGALLLLLASSPVALFIAADPHIYPPIDPESGGATGHSLLASSLGIIGIFIVLPLLLKRLPTEGHNTRLRAVLGFYALSWLCWAFIRHGNASNLAADQVFGLFVLVIWIPVVSVYLLGYQWPQATRKWLWAFLSWWGLLTFTGFLDFMPGMLDLVKFTNALVAHAHLAMAGMVTSLNMLILGTLNERALEDGVASWRSFWVWQGGCAVYVIAMQIQGIREGLDPTVLFDFNLGTTLLYTVRLMAGIAMTVAGISWLRVSLKAGAQYG